MRACPVVGAVVLVAVAALGTGCGGGGVDRWNGKGCQPACVRQTSDGTPALACVTPGNNIDKCQDMNVGNVTCEGEGVPSCDTDDGRPRCPDPERERPICTR